MSRHISALCITPPEGLKQTTFWGRGVHGGWRRHTSHPFKAPIATQLLPPRPTVAGGHLWGEHLPLHSPVSYKERGVQHLFLLRFKLERHTTRRGRRRRREIQWLIDLFSGQSGHTAAVSSMEDQIPDSKTLLCCVSCLLYSWTELRVLVSAHFRKLHTQVTEPEFDLIIFSVEVLVTGSLKFIVQVSKVASVVSMKYICKLCLIYNLKEKNNGF